jgi:uncharacterized protein (TIGR02996 family)
MSDEPALIEAIRKYWEDDTARLAYADWLEENGDRQLPHMRHLPRLIRVQCELARSPNPTSEQELRRQERSLLNGPAIKYFREVLAGSQGSAIHAVQPQSIKRGFPSSIECLAEWWIRNGDSVLCKLPLLSVTLTTSPRCEQTEDGLLILGDPLGEPVMPGTRQPGERLELTACLARWKGVRFQLPPVFTAQANLVGPAAQINASGRVNRISQVKRVGQSR